MPLKPSIADMLRMQQHVMLIQSTFVRALKGEVSFLLGHITATFHMSKLAIFSIESKIIS